MSDLTTHAAKLAPTLAKSHDRPVSLDNPRAPRRQTKGNFELYSWVFMRLSGVALILLVFTHLIYGLLIATGVHRVSYSYVADRWSNPAWQLADLAMLWLAQLHGGNGLRTVIADYTRKDISRFWLNTLLAISMVLIMSLGAYTILTFDPHIH
ncbi:MAG: succinate dehydrogenase hydrophobic membrane anchor subunit [Mycobacteriaceae bacterium]|nr:succinate dehydrogenase hydrophobic membrane anchor subunit [Mycobacteriaceae bacterium]